MPATPDGVTDLLDTLQSALSGSMELDARVDSFLRGRDFVGMDGGGRYVWRGIESGPGFSTAEPEAPWTGDLMAVLGLIPDDHNFAIGERDGAIWAWIQPNDEWAPTLHQMRHDHPGGSGLIVAQTLALALSAAVIAMRAATTRQAACASHA